MGAFRLRRHRISSAAAIALLFVAAALGGALIGIVRPGIEEGRHSGKERPPGRHPVVQTRRRLVGPGSSPPTCRDRCGRCFPCRPVHVVIQAGQNAPLEYYPEAWRCKCGNKLFMP